MADYQRQYRGRRRLSGNWGTVYIGGVEIFEIEKFEAKVDIEREDVIIGNDKDSKAVGVAGTGTLTIKQVFDRGFSSYLKNITRGYDERFVIIAQVADPDAVGGQRLRVRLENVQFDNIDVINFEKGAVINSELNFRWTPSDTHYESIIDIPGEQYAHEVH